MHLYLHIPFCKKACHYCDFHFRTNTVKKNTLVKAMVREIELRCDFLENKKLKTVYFGGGTPSLLTQEELTLLFSAIRDNFNFSEPLEVTLEANPDDIQPKLLDIWLEMGIDRLSLGVQTFDELNLKYMNRVHNSAQAIQSLERIRQAGFKKITADLIYAQVNPAYTEKQLHHILKQDIDTLTRFDMHHISAYNLTIEQNTVFGRWKEKKKLPLLYEDYEIEQYEILLHELSMRGYEQYEISNFAKDKAYAIHNTAYWQHQPYLGVGPSAHSFNGKIRQVVIPNNSGYIHSLAQNIIPLEIEELTPKERANEQILVGLRTKWGVDLVNLERTIEADLPFTFKRKIEDLLKKDLLVIQNQTLVLSSKGRYFADKIASDLFF